MTTMRARLNLPVTLGVLAVLTSVILFYPTPSAAQTTGTISGAVVNATTGQPLASATVTLSQFASQSAESVDTTTTTDAQGRYVFGDVDAGDGFVYATSVPYLDVLYSSGMLRFQGQTALTGDITVYETTSDPTVVQLTDRAVILAGIDPDGRIVGFTDLFVFDVSGDRTFVGGDDGRTLRFDVPANASEVTPRTGFNFGTASIEGTTVFATAPIHPGSVNASLDYTIPYRGSAVTIPITSGYAAQTLRVLLPEDDATALRLSAGDVPLLDQGILPLDDVRYHMWTTGPVQPDAVVNLTITGLPRAAGTQQQLSTVEPALIAFAALVVASLVTAWLVVRRGLHRPRPVVVAPVVSMSLDERRARLSEELRGLEAAWQAGDLDEAAYRANRRTVLEELRAISRRYRGLGDDE